MTPLTEEYKTAIENEMVVRLIQHYTKEFPQLDTEGRLRYYFCGSVATYLLQAGRKIEYFYEHQLPDLVVSEEVKYAPFKCLERAIHDIDIAQVKGRFGTFEERFPCIDRTYPEFSALTGKAEIGHLKNDSADVPTEKMAVRVSGDNFTAYVASPEQVIARKALMCQTLYSMEQKHGPDLENIVRAYSSEFGDCMREKAKQLIAAQLSPTTAFPCQHSGYQGELKRLIEEIADNHPDQSYLAAMHLSAPNRDLGLLAYLQKIPTSGGKIEFVDFVRTFPDAIVALEVDPEAKKNLEIAADFLLERGLGDAVLQYKICDEDETNLSAREALILTLKRNPWIFSSGITESKKEYARIVVPALASYPKLVLPQKRLAHSILLDTLCYALPANPLQALEICRIALEAESSQYSKLSDLNYYFLNRLDLPERAAMDAAALIALRSGISCEDLHKLSYFLDNFVERKYEKLPIGCWTSHRVSEDTLFMRKGIATFCKLAEGYSVEAVTEE